MADCGAGNILKADSGQAYVSRNFVVKASSHAGNCSPSSAVMPASHFLTVFLWFVGFP